MSNQFIIPTIFTARDVNMTSTTARIGNELDHTGKIALKTNTFLNQTGQQLRNYIGVAALVTAAIGGIISSEQTLVKYQNETTNLKALTGASQSEFEDYKNTIQTVAKDTKGIVTSAVDVAQGFTEVANNMPQLLETADGLGKVTAATILLSKASREEMLPSAQSLTTILNQYNKGAEDAARTVDMLAAGSKYGSAEINDLSASLREFGASAKLAGASLQESVAITELVSKFRKGTQAGIELRNIFTYLDTLKVQDPKAVGDLHRLGVNIDFVSDKTKPLTARLIELSKISHDDTALFHVFGKENLAMAATVLQNANGLQTLIDEIGETGVAQAMANENTQTLSASLDQLKAAWDNELTGSTKSSTGMNVAASTARFLARNLDTIIDVAVPLIGIYATYKTIVWGVKTAQSAANIATGIAAGLTSNLTIALSENAAAARAETIAIKLRTAAMWYFTEASTAAQLAIAGVVVGGLIAFITSLGQASDKSDILIEDMDEMTGKFKNIKEPINEATIAMRLYNKAVDEYNTKRDERALHDYNMKTSPVRTYLHDIFTDNPFKPKSETDTLKMPEKADYFKNLSDTSKIQIDRVPGFKPVDTSGAGGSSNNGYSAVMQNGNLKITIDNKTNNPISVDQKGTSIPVSIQQTGRYSV